MRQHVTEVPLTPDVLWQAYSEGVFPMAEERGQVEWYSVRQRALFPLEGIHVSRSLARTFRRGQFEVTFDQAFAEVMRGCFRPDGNWLTEEFVTAYSACHREGWGHSCEVWLDGNLAGGVYGLALGGAFCAESMFHTVTDASKVALKALVDKCRELGFVLFDAQVMNAHLARLGAFEVTERDYAALLEQALRVTTPWGVRSNAPQ